MNIGLQIKKKVYWDIRSFAGRYSRIYLPVQGMRPTRRDLVCRPDTDVVIEAFPRSGNTFAVTAFRFAQTYPVKIAHHLHMPAQILAGVRYRKPIMVIIRMPDDAISSLLVWEKQMPAQRAIKDYLIFYETVLRHRSSIFLTSFDAVITDFGRVIDAMNRYFGTSFKTFQHTDENVQKVFALLEQSLVKGMAQGIIQKGNVEEKVSRPSQKRKALKQKKAQELRRHNTLLSEARSLYVDLMKLADVQ